MSNVTLIILCAGNSSRFTLKAKKQWLRVDNDPIWLHVSKKLISYHNFDKVIVTSHKNEINYMTNFSDDITFVEGGDTRQNSIKNALNEVKTDYVMITDVARVDVPIEVIHKLIELKNEADCIVPVLNVADTVVYENETINRDKVKLIQTPQLSKTKILKHALNTNLDFTDDSSAIKAVNGTIKYIQGSQRSKKLTFSDDINILKNLNSPSKDSFTGIGYDIHPFENDKQMFLGGIHIDVPYGFKAHSDGDVLIHSVIDALLGAACAGDIGEFFPDTSEEYKDVDSKTLLKHIVNFIYNVGYEIINIDLTIIAQQPKINPYKTLIKSKLAELLNIEKRFINIKATTAEKLGFIGRKEGVAVQSVATLKYYDWKKK
ncbi:bifunctional 2-C-methyl-D-erythritol 4-phosphate cytidylyltransferase/2-C-methyl-D-erythritol 2,4-cyclodiphosphate synthase [Malaciobacter halophilus]|uniref:Bifunctional enzyme IspD/IspF n=1 Tax=Malaciobacter halophilus TaxID=197482 RepID=A0A2N1J374_9BACT|nr:bifunctional 2-C-methyl-D-erythritol 4-phosphate cytidylyltransferase/2-C-methyl-D-erythritol 2,4-cyclodiphosphate synthase [Malaciobacter halophilus]AXH08569.1 bifunctional 2-C-methyl-D-erythritol 4-phosphate cytidylyltransferase / 2-C-methyl-D-erythritol 2,4-cyclodiphosphate synthase protein [Malaciobacter halophilus]PKI81006.1 bifunctional 2-C-methyl-D-erythritol 4-phosphate cytidylyltransferase/2-C-methyl-D-erythritol 2,4-cyclodiphosphate synthase [Malaciobacter halophilus]